MRASAYVPVAGLPGANALFVAYLHQFEKLADFYAVDYRSAAAMRAHAAAVAAAPYPRQQVAAILLEQNQRWGAGEKTRQHVTALAEANSLAVVTGQQVGLFGGPLLTLYKALTCARLAQKLSADLQRPVVPVFWLAADDDDLAEANRATVLAQDNALLTLSCNFPPEQRQPMSLTQLPDDVLACHAKLNEAITAEFKHEVLPALAEAYVPGRSLPEAFARWMNFVLGELGVVLLDPSAPAFKQLAQPIFSKELEEQSPSTAAALRASAALEQSGYAPQVPLRPGRCNLFYVDGQRHALEWQDGIFATTDGKKRLRKAEWLRHVNESPASFSPNVILRPVLQDFLLPTLAYVAGPAEIAYFAQLRGVYENFGVRMPAIYPRQTLTLLEKKISHVLEKYGLQLTDFWQDPEQLFSQTAKRKTPAELFAPIAAARENLSRSFAALKEHAVALDPTLAAFLEKEQGRVFHQLETVEKKIVQASKRKNEILRHHLEKAGHALFPRRHLQERELNLTVFFCKYGPGFVTSLYEALDLNCFQHQIITW